MLELFDITKIVFSNLPLLGEGKKIQLIKLKLVLEVSDWFKLLVVTTIYYLIIMFNNLTILSPFGNPARLPCLDKLQLLLTTARSILSSWSVFRTVCPFSSLSSFSLNGMRNKRQDLLLNLLEIQSRMFRRQKNVFLRDAKDCVKNEWQMWQDY